MSIRLTSAWRKSLPSALRVILSTHVRRYEKPPLGGHSALGQGFEG
jgi:hypothetical protein